MKTISILLPCRNEEKFIGPCLKSLVENDYPQENVEILVIDGMSEDGTRTVVGEYAEKYPWIRLVDNIKRLTPFAWNIGIQLAQGDLIGMFGAHARYTATYLSECVHFMDEYKADVVGGGMEVLPARDTSMAATLAVAISHPFGSGFSYKSGLTNITWVDAVFAGLYRKELFQEVGLLNENLERSQDMDFNMRLRKAGKRLLLVPQLKVEYFPKATLWEFFRHNIIDGVWAVYPLKFGVSLFSWRHLLPLFFMVILGATFFFSWRFFILLMAFYAVINMACSLHLAFIYRKIHYAFLAPIAFAARHFGYGLGSVFGVLKIMFERAKMAR